MIDLRSDTVTKPTPLMRKAMFEAEVGDDVYREDPTVLELERKAAEFLGKEAALFVTSGTMGNLCCVMVHCWTRGQEILVGDKSHIYFYEQGGVSQLAGVHSRAVSTKPDGTFDLKELQEKIRKGDDAHQPYTGLICLENTHNVCGGVALPLDYITEVCRLAKSYNIPVHMDGARIVNAAVCFGRPVKELLKDCDSVSMCLSKGLGAPVGSVVGGSKSFIEKVLRCRKVLGGGMRQSGILAAAGIVALDVMTKRIEEDHRHASLLSSAISLQNLEKIQVDRPSSWTTNMVLLNFPDSNFNSNKFIQRLMEVSDQEKKDLGAEIRVKVSRRSEDKVRCVLHADVLLDDVNAVITKITYIIKELE